ncbi:hypothetical protein BST85_01565 [Aureitalea marina]|uniref:Peptidase n=2 Tax=Aureitalea marina TaxID=930804 RepID=A0A2S7KM76_9FLAO|nr:hypothetical protein BST85_01565 [Aureitalea marina]
MFVGLSSALGQNNIDIVSAIQSGDSNQMVVTSEHISSISGIHHIYVRQALSGIEIVGTESSVHLGKDGEALVVHNSFVPSPASLVRNASANLSAEEAILSVARERQYGEPNLRVKGVSDDSDRLMYDKSIISTEDIPVRQVYLLHDEQLYLVWELSIAEVNSSDWLDFFVDASTGKILRTDNWTNYCEVGTFNNLSRAERALTFDTRLDQSEANAFNFSAVSGGDYTVYPVPLESPNHGSRSTINDAEDAIASPFGWHDTNGTAGVEYTITRGNNVYAYEDRDANNIAGYSPDGGGSLDFDFPLDFNQAPSGYQDAAITNLFFWNNVIHDMWYHYGFTESAGNFQQNNYGNGGSGSDYVRAEAQDGSGTNNANFATPSDGSRPRMQMYVWDPASVSDLLTINSPAGIAGDYSGVEAGFGPGITAVITADLALIEDDNSGASTDTSDGCDNVINGADLSGKIVVIRRGSCEFGTKVLAAENAGATAVIMVNNVATDPIVMGAGAVGGSVTIPSIMVSQADGQSLIDQLELSNTVNGTLQPGGFQIDGDFDNGIIAHEYGHGVSNRLTNGPSSVNCLGNAEQMGEGWSDYIGLMMTIEPGDSREDIRGIGTFALGQSTTGDGIRPAPYSTDTAINNYTYGNSNSGVSQPHGIGFVWATILWEMTWDLIDKYGFDNDFYQGTGGNNIAMALVTEGMKLQPCSPGFVDGRDAILAADQALYDGANKCLLWKAFARRGLGASASQGSSNNRSDQTEAFDLPGATWNGSAWAGNIVPDRGYSLNIQGDFDSSVDGELIPTTTIRKIEACSCTISNNSTVRIKAEDYMLIDENITVESGSTLIVEHQGVVVQTDGTASVVNNGTINVEITTPNLLRDDFMAVGSPMSAETVAGVFGGVRNVQYHTPENFIPNTPGSGVTNFSDDNGNFWRRYNSGSLTAGEGYLIFPQDNPSGTTDLTFSLGTLNNGDVSRPMVFNGDGVNEYGTPNVYANPYASPISADDFLSANGLTDVYFWEHITAPSSIIPGPYARNYSMDDISIYNDISGGLAAANDGGGTTQPNGIISTAQGFGVLATSGGNVTFTNSMRRTSGNTTLRTQDLELDRMWFRVSSDAYEYPLGSNTLIAYSPEATDGLDGGDTNRLDTSVSLYSTINGTNKNLTIQSLEQFDQEDKISLGFSTLVEADLEYTIALTQVQGTQLGDRSIYLIDNLLGRITDLTQESYSFRSGAGDQPGRFTLQFEYQTLATVQNKLEAIGLYPNPTDGVLNIVSPRSPITQVTIYDLQGRVVKRIDSDQSNLQLNLDQLNSGIYLVQIKTDAGMIAKKLVKE